MSRGLGQQGHLEGREWCPAWRVPFGLSLLEGRGSEAFMGPFPIGCTARGVCIEGEDGPGPSVAVAVTDF